jgi:lipopolysaccharide transport system permease protein
MTKLQAALHTLCLATQQFLKLIYRHRKILVATTKVEIAKRHSGSALGLVWVILYPLLLLGVYLFIYLGVFKMQLAGYSGIDYVLYVFSGLIPFLGFSEAIQAGTQSIKQNLHLVKNVMLPIEIIPVRTVLAALVSQVVSIGIVVLLVAANGSLSMALVWLPVVFLLQLAMLIGLTLVLAALALVFQDVSYFINIALMLLMFLSPIGYTVDMLPRGLEFVVWMNPITYLCEAYRFVFLGDHAVSAATLIIYAVSSVVVVVIGTAFFQRFKGVLVDYE